MYFLKSVLFKLHHSAASASRLYQHLIESVSSNPNLADFQQIGYDYWMSIMSPN